jgi:polyisoprenoid-binding protein YceI
MIRALPLLLLLPLPAVATEYAVDPSRSQLSFAGSAQGESFEGRFARFSATVSIDGAATALTAEVDVTSVDTQNSERDETLATAEFFDFEKFPKATFRTTSCRAAGAGRFECDAELTIRDRTRKLAFPFTLNEGGKATLDAKVTLDRTQFDVGTGDWAGEDAVAHAVAVTVHLALTPK